MNKLLFSSIKEVSQKIISDDIKPSDLCKAALNVLSITKPLNAYITITNDIAICQSKNADERLKNETNLGPLNGIPIAIKDNYCTKGERTTCASLMLDNFIPAYDATVYARLKEQGTVLIGKTNLDEFAMGSGTIDSYYGPSKNIWGSNILSEYFNCITNNKYMQIENYENDNWYITGGSSGGSAVAVATGTCYAALGSDTGGSTRNPASYCGLIGLKPTYGLISRYGLIPLVNSMDVPGILTRTVDDAVQILNAIAGPDSADSTTVKMEYESIDIPDKIDVTGLVVGIPKEYMVNEISTEMKQCWQEVRDNLEEAGAKIVDVSLPHTNFSIVCYSVLNRCDVASNLACYDGIKFGYRADTGDTFKDLYRNSRSEAFNDIVKGRILTGNFFLLSENYEQYYIKAMKLRRLITQDFNSIWNNNIDLLLTPTTLTEAPKYKDFVLLDNQTQCLIQDYCTQPANMAGVPAINVPIKLSANRLPLSLQLIAPVFHEKRLLYVAKCIEKIVNFPKLELKEDIKFE